MKKIFTAVKMFGLLLCLIIFKPSAIAQTDIDGILMQKNFFCVGPTVSKSSWKNYWEGTYKRDNANLGTVSATTAAIMGNYGINDKLNVLFGLPYISTRANAGNLKGQKGLQDLSFWVKWVAKEKMIGKGNLKAILLGGYSNPVTNYYIDLMPTAIGLHSKTGSLRVMADYEMGDWFATISGTYMLRSNVTLDRNTYYTTEMHYTNEVKMPDASDVNFRIGYRSSTWIVEGIVDKFSTLGGFDITKNNMPFVSNNMDATKLALHVKYDTDFVNGLSFVADANTTIAGRNVGQSTSFGGGVFYIFDLSKKKKKEDTKDKH
ncbi:MAG: hypothetical protein JST86_10620 [Bacteroidetes bacterium]|nr:hypothetical protein [Bacteroidota bacterium]